MPPFKASMSKSSMAGGSKSIWPTPGVISQVTVVVAAEEAEAVIAVEAEAATTKAGTEAVEVEATNKVVVVVVTANKEATTREAAIKPITSRTFEQILQLMSISHLSPPHALSSLPTNVDFPPTALLLLPFSKSISHIHFHH